MINIYLIQWGGFYKYGSNFKEQIRIDCSVTFSPSELSSTESPGYLGLNEASVDLRHHAEFC